MHTCGYLVTAQPHNYLDGTLSTQRDCTTNVFAVCLDNKRQLLMDSAHWTLPNKCRSYTPVNI